MIVRYPAEANLVSIMDGEEMDQGLQRIKRWAYSARGFRGHLRHYVTSIAIDYMSNPQGREALIECQTEIAQQSLQDLLYFEYRNPRGRWHAACRDAKQAIWARIPLRLKTLYWKLTPKKQYDYTEDDDE